MERLRNQKSAGVHGDRTFDFLAANSAKMERQERRQLDAMANGEQRVRVLFLSDIARVIRSPVHTPSAHITATRHD